jgi:hypothetical protein
VASSRPRAREGESSRGDREVIASILRDVEANPNSTARQVRSRLERDGLVLTKSEVNSHLYRALKSGTVVHDDQTPPLWSAVEQDSDSEVTEADWIIDFYLEATRQSWSIPQRLAAADGARVQVLKAFTKAELTEAARRVPDNLSWDLWNENAVAVRSESFKL